MDKKMSIGFVEDFISKIFNNTKPEGVYMHFYSDNVYYYSDGILYLIPTGGQFCGHYWTLNIGCSKAAFVFDDFDEVIKIGFTGEVCIGTDVEIDTSMLEVTSYNIPESEWVVLDDFPINYLTLETDIYQKVNLITRKFLLKNEIVYRTGKVEIGIQEKIQLSYRGKHYHTSEEVEWSVFESIRPMVANYITNSCVDTKLPKLFLVDICNVCGGKLPEEVLCDIENLTDLHEYNIGYVTRNSELFPVILDYAGFVD